jgi:hypothetical protein
MVAILDGAAVYCWNRLPVDPSVFLKFLALLPMERSGGGKSRFPMA